MPRHYLFLFLVIFSIRVVKVVGVVIASIGYRFLSFLKPQNKGATRQLQVWPFTAWNTAVCPDDFAGSYTNAYFIPQAWAVEFVGIPFRTEWRRLIYTEIRSINRDEGVGASCRSLEPVFPFYLNILTRSKCIEPSKIKQRKEFFSISYHGHFSEKLNGDMTPFAIRLFRHTNQSRIYMLSTILLQMQQGQQQMLWARISWSDIA